MPASRAVGLLIQHYFSSPERSGRYLTPLVHKGAKNTINVSDEGFLRGRILLPTDPIEIEKINAGISTLDAKIDAVAAQIQHMETFRRGLIQGLFP